MKKILGFDIGTNSIGWAIVYGDTNEDGKLQLKEIANAGSRIIPMDASILGDFDKGNSVSQTKARTEYRGMRRMRERYLLRRERLYRILNIMGFLPEHFSECLTRYGKFTNNSEPKLAWLKDNEGKMQFLFKQSFNEMLNEFYEHNPQLTEEAKKIPYDWTLYYLRKKALTAPIQKEELAWILLNFNQKRGYYQLRGEDEEDTQNKIEEYQSLKIIRVEATDEKKGDDTWHNVYLENGMVYRRTSKTFLDWEGKTKDFIITTLLDNNGQPKVDKDGQIRRSLRQPKEEDWGLLKKKTEASIDKSGKTVGCYIYDNLLSDPTQKIKGRLVRTIERKYYKNELKAILEKQKQFIPELNDKELYDRCVEELYPSNDAHRNNIIHRDFTYLIAEDILFYQRPLKSKKSLIADCQYETRAYKNPETGETKHIGIKCVSKSHPRFQEFRLWQFISNLRIYERSKIVDGKTKLDVDVTDSFLKDETVYERLFEFLNNTKAIKQDTLLSSFFKLKKQNGKHLYRWNYVEDREYPCNETRELILSRLKKAGISASFLTTETEEALWHILYSVSDKQELRTALATFARKNTLDETTFTEHFIKIPPFKNDYGAYSLKALNKLLPLIRMGKYWSEESIDAKTRERIDRIIDGEADENIKNTVREKAINLNDISHFKGLPLWLACYVVYNRHSEASDTERWERPEDIDEYLRHFRQHSLNNPIVEQVVMETLRTVRDIWKTEGHIDEIHIELGREMKSPAAKRAQMAQNMTENENTNIRIKYLLREFASPDIDIEGVHTHSPSQQELLRIYEEGVLASEKDIAPDIKELIGRLNEKSKQPSHSDVQRYKLWLDQKYRSPYTGLAIPLSRLFTPDYEIEHVIPQSRYFDNSFTNKVICESEVNKLKDNQLGYEFIMRHHGEKVPLSRGRTATILEPQEYEQLVKKTYSTNPQKLKKLMMDDIPDGFIDRQLNDSRYISKLVKGLMSKIVREEGEDEATSKNVIVCTGSVTDRLKKDWGINDVWNRIILPRFERLDKMCGQQLYTTKNTSGHVIPDMPLEQQRGFNKKRIDHRHHAMDAIVIACATRSIVNYLNNESAKHDAQTTRHDLQHALCHKQRTDANGNYRWTLNKPWDTFPADVNNALNRIIVSFKQNLRVISRTKNKIQKLKNNKRVLEQQTKGDNWAIRKPLHKETVYGEVNLRLQKEVKLKEAITRPDDIIDRDLKKKIKAMLELGYDLKKIKAYFEDNAEIWSDINLNKIPIYYFTAETSDRYFATRKPIDQSFNRKKIINEITDTGIQKIMLHHLENNGEDPDIAFSPEGIEEMNRNIRTLNNGKWHQPILKVRVYEKANKFAIGKSGNKSKKFVEAAKGTNLFFAVYESEDGKRRYSSIPLNIVIDRMKAGQPVAGEDGIIPTFVLSPGDLVYVPHDGEQPTANTIDRSRIYKMVSCNKKQCFFIGNIIASIIVNNNDLHEFNAHNMIEIAPTGENIKEKCIPIKVDRLGQIVKLGY